MTAGRRSRWGSPPWTPVLLLALAALVAGSLACGNALAKTMFGAPQVLERAMRPMNNPSVSGGGGGPSALVVMAWTGLFRDQASLPVTFEPMTAARAVAQTAAGHLDFAILSEPLASATLGASGLTQVPLLAGGVVPVFNLAGISGGELTLSGAVLADIFQGRITRWNDPAIAALNGGLTLPRLPIQVLHRTDPSVPTLYFSEFLAHSSPAWRARPGSGPRVAWPVGSAWITETALLDALSSTPGAIGYADFDSAVRERIAVARLVNAAGTAVTASPAAFAAAMAGTDWSTETDAAVLPIDAAGPNSWPITKATFLLMARQPTRPAHVDILLAFCHWAVTDDRAAASAAHSGQAPIPAAVLTKLLPASAHTPATPPSPLSKAPPTVPQTAEVRDGR